MEARITDALVEVLHHGQRLALMVERKVHHRGDKRRAALLKRAPLCWMAARTLAITDLIKPASACIGVRNGAVWLPLLDGSAAHGHQQQRTTLQCLTPGLRVGRPPGPVPQVVNQRHA